MRKINFKYESIDSFVGDIKSNNLIILGSKSGIKKPEYINGFISNLLNQKIKILFLSLASSKGKILLDFPCLNNKNVNIYHDILIDISEIYEIYQTNKKSDLIIIDGIEEIDGFTRYTKYKSSNLIYQLKNLAVKMGKPVIGILRNNRYIVPLKKQELSLQNYEYKELKSISRYGDYCIFLNDHSHRTEKQVVKIKADMFNCKKNDSKTVDMLFIYESNTLIELTYKIKELIRDATTIGLEYKDAVEYASYWGKNDKNRNKINR